MALKYEEYLKMLKDNATQKYDATMAQAKGTLNEQQTAANAAFERSKPTYGMMAEQMAQSGLTGSGYSDNITRDAYAARQAGYDSAYKTYGDTARVAEQTKYADLLAAEEAALTYKEGLDQSFDLIYADIAQGTSKSDLDYYIKRHGFSKAQADSLYKKAGWTLLTEGEYQSLMGSSPETETTPEKEPIVEPSQNTIDAINAWKLEDITPENAQEWLASAKLLMDNDSVAEGKILEWLLKTPVVNNLTDTSGGATVGDYLFSKGVLKEDDDLYKKFIEKKNANPELKPGEGGDPEAKFYATGLKVNNGLNTSGGAGDNFSVTDGDRKYRIQLGEKTADGVILNKASELADGTIFMYDGKAYIKVKTDDGQDVWSVDGRPLWPGHYADFVEAAKSSMSSNGTGVMSGGVGQDRNGNAVITIKGTSVKVKGVKADSDVMDYANKNGVRSGEFFYKGEDLCFLDGNGYVWKIYEGADEFKEYYDLKKGTISKDAFTPVTADLSGTLNILGDNFTATIGGVKYKVQTGERASAAVEDFVTKEGSNIPEKSLFKYDGKLYMRDKKKVYEVEARPVFNKGDYADLIAALGIKE